MIDSGVLEPIEGRDFNPSTLLEVLVTDDLLSGDTEEPAIVNGKGGAERIMQCLDAVRYVQPLRHSGPSEKLLLLEEENCLRFEPIPLPDPFLNATPIYIELWTIEEMILAHCGFEPNQLRTRNMESFRPSFPKDILMIRAGTNRKAGKEN